MNTNPAIKLIKKDERKCLEVQAAVEPADGPNSWFTAVRLWVVEFQQHRHAESLPAFDSLFKDALS